jgi:hypothetical protein
MYVIRIGKKNVYSIQLRCRNKYKKLADVNLKFRFYLFLKWRKVTVFFFNTVLFR